MQQATQMKMQQQQLRNPLQTRKGTPRQKSHQSTLPQGQRIYASENEMPSDATIPLELADIGPFTPKKTKANNAAPSPTQQQQPASKSKARSSTTATRPRPKHASTSPGPARPGQKISPLMTASKISSTPAFAGATFHASPEPSSLPMPSFLLKGLDSPSLKESGRASREPSPPATDSEAPTPQHLASKPTVDQSPLDFFFKAHKAEQEMARRASSPIISTRVLTGPCSPPQQTASVKPENLPRTFESVDAKRVSAHRNPFGIPSMELDGTPGRPMRPMGPAFSTPYTERIRAVRSSEKQTTPTDDKSAELMQYLGVKPSYSLARDPSRTKCTGMESAQNSMHRRAASQAALFPQPAPQPAPQPPSGPGDRPRDILALEDSLRKVLKLDGLNQGPVEAATHSFSD